MSEFAAGDDVYYIRDGQRRDGKIRTFAELCKIVSGKDYQGRALNHALEAGAPREELYVVWNDRAADGTYRYCNLKTWRETYNIQKHEQPCHRCGLPLTSELRLVDGKHVCDLGDIADQCERYYQMLSRICLDEQAPHETYVEEGETVVSRDVINAARESIGWRKL